MWDSCVNHHLVWMITVAMAAIALLVNVSNITHQVSNLTLACHSDTGYAHQARGFYSQLCVDESFEAE